MAIYELDLEELEKVNGGSILTVSEGMKVKRYGNQYIRTPSYKFYVIDDKNGQELGQYANAALAELYCTQNGISSSPITWEEVQALREKNK